LPGWAGGTTLGDMSRIRIYSKEGCPFSERARLFLEEKGIPYDEVDITRRPDLRAEMIREAGGADTTPQIFLDDRHLGGYDDLVEEDRQGRLAAAMASGLDAR
jgi:glutaredoxin 3